MKFTILLATCTLSLSFLAADMLKVRGTAQLKKPADLATLSIGVTTQEATAKDALDTNSRMMEEAIRSIKDLGLKGTEVQTGQFSIFPLQDNKGFSVNNTLHISTKAIENIGKLIDAATKAGANQIHSLTFALEDPRKYRADAIDEATKNAKEDAQALAESADVTLNKIHSIELIGDGPVHFPKVAMMSARSTPIEARDVTVSATVEVEYEIN